MQTRAALIADGIFRLSTYVPEVAAPDGFAFIQFVIVADEPLLSHGGQRKLFPAVSAGGRADPAHRAPALDQLRPLEADESGAINLWLAAAPASTACLQWSPVRIAQPD